MELHPSPGLKRSFASVLRRERYRSRLPTDADRRPELLRAITDGLEHAAALGQSAADEAWERAPQIASLSARLALARGEARGEPARAEAFTAGECDLPVSPPIQRSSMVPRRWPLRVGLWRRVRAARHDEQALNADRGARRRTLLTLLTLAQTLVATWAMTSVLPYHGTRVMEMVVLVLFGILFFWVSAGFWTAIMGFFVLLRGGDRQAISASAAPDAPIDASARTAIIMPICNEDVERVFAGLRATYASVERCGELARFDFFVLSDSNDADLIVAEASAWHRLCDTVGGFGRVFYRRRRSRIKRKSGNVADFCRRWGKTYRYMVVLDADSVMSGECLTTLVRLMEANPGAGIIQTAPRASGKESPHARIQQFANRVYGPLFTAGLHFWQLGEAHYWGHNAIIRLAPFIRHCAIGRLERGGVRNLEVLSHDFVEAALMRRAGWSVWIAYDLPGSHEEMPPNLLDELQRDQRWCQGNLINSRLMLAEGLHPAHRIVFATGVMAYLSAPLWLLFLLFSTLLLAVQTLVPPQYFTVPYQLFPVWPEWNHRWAVSLFSATTTLLFAPKVLGLLLLWRQGSRDFGGACKAPLSTLAEIVYSVLLAPIRMLFHSRFVAATLAGRETGWKSPPRDNSETTWREAIRRNGVHTLLGALWGGSIYWLNHVSLWWILPIVGALLLSIPLSVWSSQIALGRRLRRWRLFLVPEESQPPYELRRLKAFMRSASEEPGFAAAVVDPLTNALVCAIAGAHRANRKAIPEDHRAAIDTALAGGPQALNASQKLELLGDPAALARLHFMLWTATGVHPAWSEALGERPCNDAISSA